MEQSNHCLKYSLIKLLLKKFFFLLILSFSIFNVKCQNKCMDSTLIKLWKIDSCGSNGGQNDNNGLYSKREKI